MLSDSAAIDNSPFLAEMRDHGKTIFVVTHQASLLDGAADEFIWMESGKIVRRTRELQLAEVL